MITSYSFNRFLLFWIPILNLNIPYHETWQTTSCRTALKQNQMLRTFALKSLCSASWISSQQCKAVRQKEPRRQHPPLPLWYVCYLVGSSFHLFKAPFGNFPPGLASEKKPYKELRIVLQNTGLRLSEYVSLVLFAFQTAQMKVQMPKKAAGA